MFLRALNTAIAWPGRILRRYPAVGIAVAVAVLLLVALVPVARATRESLSLAQAMRHQYDACIRQGLPRSVCEAAYGGGGGGNRGGGGGGNRGGGGGSGGGSQNQKNKCKEACKPCNTCRAKGKPCKKKCQACDACHSGGGRGGSGGGTRVAAASVAGGGGSGLIAAPVSGGRRPNKLPASCKMRGTAYADIAGHSAGGFSRNNTRATYHYYAPNYETLTLACADKFHKIDDYGRKLLQYPWMAFCAAGDKRWDSSVCGKCYKVTNRRTGASIIARAVDQGGCTDADGTGLDLDPCAFNAIDTDGRGVADGNMRVDVQEVRCKPGALM